MDTIKIAGETLLTPKQLAETGVISLPQQSILRREGKLKCYKNGARVLYSWENHVKPYLASEQPTAEQNAEVN